MTDYPYQANQIGTGTLNTPEQRNSNPIGHAEELRMLVKLDGRSRDYTDKAMLSAAEEIERLTRDRDLWKERHDRERAAHAKNLTEQQKCEGERDTAREALRVSEAWVRELSTPGYHRLRAALEQFKKAGDPEGTANQRWMFAIASQALDGSNAVETSAARLECPTCGADWHWPTRAAAKATGEPT